MCWTNERVDLLKNLWAEGASASVIATRLGEVTRNAVIGKVHRLSLARRKTGARKAAAPMAGFPFAARNRPRKLRPPSCSSPPAPRRHSRAQANLPEPGPAPEHAVTVLTLTTFTCRWPEGDPKHPDFHFCGRSKPEGLVPYCEHHAAIAYR